MFPVKEKVKMIAQQQEEIVRREEMKRVAKGSSKVKSQDEAHGRPTGGVRILPPSPTTDLLETAAASPPILRMQQGNHYIR